MLHTRSNRRRKFWTINLPVTGAAQCLGKAFRWKSATISAANPQHQRMEAIMGKKIQGMEIIETPMRMDIGIIEQAGCDPASQENHSFTEMADFIRYVFGLTAEHLPHEDAIKWRAESWSRLLGPDFFKPETRYVVEICCKIRGDRRDAIKPDEILRIA